MEECLRAKVQSLSGESWNALYLASNLVVTPLYLNYAKDPFIPVTLTLVSEIVQSTMPSKNKSMD